MTDFPASITQQFMTTMAFVAPSDSGFCATANDRACDFYKANQSCCCQGTSILFWMRLQTLEFFFSHIDLIAYSSPFTEEVSRYRTCYINEGVSSSMQLPVPCEDSCNWQSGGNDESGKSPIAMIVVFLLLIATLIAMYFLRKRYMSSKQNTKVEGTMGENDKAQLVAGIYNHFISYISPQKKATVKEEENQQPTKIESRMPRFLQRLRSGTKNQNDDTGNDDATKEEATSSEIPDVEKGQDEQSMSSSESSSSFCSDESSLSSKDRIQRQDRMATTSKKKVAEPKSISSHSSSSWSSSCDESSKGIHMSRVPTQAKSEQKSKPETKYIQTHPQPDATSKHRARSSDQNSSHSKLQLARERSNESLMRLEKEMNMVKSRLYQSEQEAQRLRLERDQQEKRISKLESKESLQPGGNGTSQQPANHRTSRTAWAANQSASQFLNAHRALREGNSGSTPSVSNMPRKKSSRTVPHYSAEGTQEMSKVQELCVSWHSEPKLNC